MSTDKEPEVTSGSKEMELEVLRERIRQKKLQRQKDQKKNNPYVISKTGTYPSKVTRIGNSSPQEQAGIYDDNPNSEIDLRSFLEPKAQPIGSFEPNNISNSNFDRIGDPPSDMFSESFHTRSSSTLFGSNEYSNGLYATPDSDNMNEFELHQNNSNSQSVSYAPAMNHPIPDYSQLLAQYRNSTNPIISALINNDFGSKFHPMNLIPDTPTPNSTCFKDPQESNAFPTGAQMPNICQIPKVSQVDEVETKEKENTSSFGQIPIVKPTIEPSLQVSTKPASTFNPIPIANPYSHQKNTSTNPMVWTRQTSSDSTPISAPTPINAGDEYVSWVSKGGMTLISKTVYERDEAKFKAVRSNIQAEKTKYQKQKLEHKKKLLEKKRALAKQQRISRNRTKTDFCDRIEIDGEKFAVTAHGAKLIILSPNAISIEEKTKSITWCDNNYVRQPTGNLKTKTLKGKKDDCRYFSREGICEKGSTCKYAHTKLRIRICQQYLLNKCYDQNCLLSHEANDSNTPLCYYYLKGNCTNPSCLFMHRKPDHYDDPDYEIWVCRQFAIGGYCDRGKICPTLHVLNCPDFEEEGKCPRGRSCTLGHPVTQRTQRLMETPSNKYEREIDEVIVENDQPEKIMISSYTIDPKLLLTVIPRGKYDIYLDNGNPVENTPPKDNPFLISISDTSDSNSDYESDEIKKNNDYIGV